MLATNTSFNFFLLVIDLVEYSLERLSLISERCRCRSQKVADWSTKLKILTLKTIPKYSRYTIYFVSLRKFNIFSIIFTCSKTKIELCIIKIISVRHKCKSYVFIRQILECECIFDFRAIAMVIPKSC